MATLGESCNKNPDRMQEKNKKTKKTCKTLPSLSYFVVSGYLHERRPNSKDYTRIHEGGGGNKTKHFKEQKEKNKNKMWFSVEIVSLIAARDIWNGKLIKEKRKMQYSKKQTSARKEFQKGN